MRRAEGTCPQSGQRGRGLGKRGTFGHETGNPHDNVRLVAGAFILQIFPMENQKAAETRVPSILASLSKMMQPSDSRPVDSREKMMLSNHL